MMIFAGKKKLPSRAVILLDALRKAHVAFATPRKNVIPPLYNIKSFPSASLCIILADTLVYKIFSWVNYYQRILSVMLKLT